MTSITTRIQPIGFGDLIQDHRPEFFSDEPPPIGWQPQAEPAKRPLKFNVPRPASDNLSIPWGNKPDTCPIKNPYQNRPGDGFRLLRGLAYAGIVGNTWAFRQACRPEVRRQVLEMQARGDSRSLVALVKDADKLLAAADLKADRQWLDNLLAQGEQDLFVSAVEFFKEAPAPAYLAKPLIEQNSDCALIGQHARGKSFLAIDLACCIATGGTWLNRYQCEQGAVLYLFGEGFPGGRRRIRAWAVYHSTERGDMKLLFGSKQAVSFSAAGIQSIIAAGRAIEKQTDTRVKLIVIDTQHRHFKGDENSAADDAMYCHHRSTIREAFPGSVTLNVHHTGHSDPKRPRGSSASSASFDLIMLADGSKLEFTKVKDGELPPPVHYRIESVELGIDSEGESVSSAVVVASEPLPKYQKQAQFTAQERIVVDLLHDVGTEGMHANTLRQAFFTKRRDDNPSCKTNTVKNAFLNALKSLECKGAIELVGEVYFVRD